MQTRMGGWALLGKSQQGCFEKATSLTCLCKIIQIRQYMPVWCPVGLSGPSWP